MKKITALAMAMALYCGSASGAVIYNETTDGDLLGLVDPLTTFNFTIGANTISGTTGYGQGADFDSFAFVVPSGTSLASASLVMNLGGGLGSVDWQFRKGSAVLFAGTFLEMVGSAQDFTTMPQLADTYQIYGNSFGGLTGTVTYTFTFNVTADRGGPDVPEPASMVLLGCGLFAVLAVRRR